MENSSITRVRVLISGRVQGVSCRYYTTIQAKKLGITGWVRNLPDGRVEAIFEGNQATINTMINWCQQGPPAASVTNVKVSREEPEGFTSFETRR